MKMKIVLVATEKPFAKCVIKTTEEALNNAGLKLQLLQGKYSLEDFVNAVKDADALIVRSDKVTKEVIEAGKNLKIIIRAGAGVDNIDLEACTEKGVIVENTPGQNSNAVAELTVGMMVFAAREFFSGKSGSELRGKKLGLHGFGNIGKIVANIAAKGFGMTVCAYDPFIWNKWRGFVPKDGIMPVREVEDLYANCDYISLHIPLNKETVDSINWDLLSLMRQGAVLVNTARKEIVKKSDLLRAMEEKNLKYVSDIAPDNTAEFEEKFKGRFFFTPQKMGAETIEANNNAGLAAASQIVDFLKTGGAGFRVN